MHLSMYLFIYLCQEGAIHTLGNKKRHFHKLPTSTNYINNMVPAFIPPQSPEQEIPCKSLQIPVDQGRRRQEFPPTGSLALWVLGLRAWDSGEFRMFIRGGCLGPAYIYIYLYIGVFKG